MKLTRQSPTTVVETEFRSLDSVGVQLNRTYTFKDGKYKGRKVHKEVVLSHYELLKLQEFINS